MSRARTFIPKLFLRGCIRFQGLFKRFTLVTMLSANYQVQEEGRPKSSFAFNVPPGLRRLTQFEETFGRKMLPVKEKASKFVKMTRSFNRKMASLSSRKLLYFTGGGGLLTILGLYLGWSGFPYLINSRIKQEIILLNGSDALKRFEKIPFPLEFKVYLFNVTNPDEIMNGERPIVKEVGPYVYDLYKEKKDLKILEDNEFILYKLTNKYFFNEEKSFPRKESDIVTLINVPLIGAAEMIKRIFPFGLAFVNTAVPYLFPNITDIFLTSSAGQFLFHGYDIPCNYSSGPAMPICNGIKGRAPPVIWQEEGSKDYKFAFFHHKNNTFEGPYKVNTGVKDVYSLGKIEEYNGFDRISVWESNTSCARLKGTDSTIFPPVMEDSKEDLYILSPDLCLSLKAKFEKKTIVNNLHLYKYVGDPKNFADEKEVPENACRCYVDEETKQRQCLKKGVIDASSCMGGVPVVASNPHLLGAHSEYTSFVRGMHPNETAHGTFVLLEPITGIPLEGRKRVQLNLIVQNLKEVELLGKVPEGLFPVIWVEEGVRLQGEPLAQLTRLFLTVRILNATRWAIIGVGLAVLLFSVFLYCKLKRLFCFAYWGNEVVPITNAAVASAQARQKRVDDNAPKWSPEHKMSIFTVPTLSMSQDERFSNKVTGQDEIAAY